MLTAYKTLVRKPHAFTTFGFGMVGRIPLALNPVALVLLIAETKNSFAIAGLASAAYTLTGAICGPRIARLADQIGRRKVLPPITLLNALSVLFILMVRHGGTIAICVASATAGATFPNFGSFTRSFWGRSLGSNRELHTALSIESVLDETAFVLGPALAGLLYSVLSPEAPLAFGLIFLLIGGFGLGYTGVPHLAAREDYVHHGGLLKIPHIKSLLLSLIFLGCVFGSNTVSTLAVAKAGNRGGDGGLLVALYSIGSLVTGGLYGLREWISPPGRRYTSAMFVMALCTTGIIITRNLDSLPFWLVLSGFAIAPALIAGNAFLRSSVPQQSLTEAFSYLGAAISIGITIGSAIAGKIVNDFGGWSGFYFVSASATFSAIVGLLGLRRREEPK